MTTIEKTKVFLSHIHEEEDVAQYLKEQIETNFLGTINVFVAGDYRSIEPGADWFTKIVDGIKESKIVLILVSSESATRPFINFEAGGAWLASKRVIPLCHSGMVPESLPEPMRRLQAINLCLPEKVKILFQQLATDANIAVPSNLPVEEIAQRIAKGEIPIPSQTSADKMFSWIRLPGRHYGETVDITVRIGDFTQCPISLARAADVDPAISLKAKIHLDPVDYRPFWECVVTGQAADFFESSGRDTWVDVKAKLVGSYDKPGFGGEDTIKLPLIIIQSAKKAVPPKTT